MYLLLQGRGDSVCRLADAKSQHLLLQKCGGARAFRFLYPLPALDSGGKCCYTDRTKNNRGGCAVLFSAVRASVLI